MVTTLMNTSFTFLGIPQELYLHPSYAAYALLEAPVDQLGIELNLLPACMETESRTRERFQRARYMYVQSLTEGDWEAAQTARERLAAVVAGIPKTDWQKIMATLEKTSWAVQGGFLATPKIRWKLRHPFTLPHSSFWENLKNKMIGHVAKSPLNYDGMRRMLQEKNLLRYALDPDDFDPVLKQSSERFHIFFSILSAQRLEVQGRRKKDTRNIGILLYLLASETNPHTIGMRLSAHFESAEDREEIIDLFAFLLDIVQTGFDPYLRYYVLWIVLALAENLRHSLHPNMELAIRMADHIAKAALRDSESANNFMGWRILTVITPEAVQIRQSDFPPKKQTKNLRTGGSLPVPRYLQHNPLHQLVWQEIAEEIQRNSLPEDAVADMETIRPILSLEDFHPDPAKRKPNMTKKLSILASVRREYPGDDREAFFRRYFSQELTQGVQDIFVLVTSSGKKLLIQGHHRLAALHAAAKMGLLPPEWLRKIPVTSILYEGEFPEALLIRTVTQGVTLKWEDLLPPPQHIQELLDR